MDTNRIKLIPASLDDYTVIQNMARFYAYDMSRDCGQQLDGWEFPENGLYECNDFKKYLEGDDKHAFLIKIDDELAGFVFVNKLEVMPEVDWNMGEFFIVAKFQRSGIGRTIAKKIFEKFPGEWSVGAIPQNARALNFWRKIIAEYTYGKFQEVEKSSEQLKTVEHPDPYPMIIIRFKAPQASSNRQVASAVHKVEPSKAEKICREITAGLPEWFGISEANERYAKGCAERTSFVAMHENIYVGMITLEFLFPNNANIYWMAVDRKYHGMKIGLDLLQAAEKYCAENGCDTITVETLSPKQDDPHYLKTYQFYQKNGFKPLFELNPYGPELLMCYMLKSVNRVF